MLKKVRGALHPCGRAALMLLATATPVIAQSVRVRVACGNCDISRTREAQLALADFAKLGNPLAIARDTMGQYLVAAGQPLIRVFDATGRFRRDIDRPIGDKEKRFRWVSNVFVAPSGNAHILDIGSRRQLVLSPAFTLVKVDTILGNVMGTPIADHRDQAVMNMYVPLPDAAPFPVHIVDGPTIVSSFGSGGNEPVRADLRTTIERKLAYDSDSTIWTARINQYRIELWTRSGERRLDLQRTPPLFPSWIEDPPPSPSQAPPSRIRAIREDLRRKQLWLLIEVPDTRWRSSIGVATTEEGTFYIVTNYNEHFDTIVEVIDLSQRAIVASHRFDEWLMGFADDRLVYSLDMGAPQGTVATLWKLDVRKPSTEGAHDKLESRK